MSDTFKKCSIFLITVAGLQIWRMVFSVINLSDNILNWLFSFLFQIIVMGVIPFLLYKFWIKKDIKTLNYELRISRKANPLSYLLAVIIGLFVFIINNTLSSVWYVFLNAVGYTYVSSVGTIYSSPEVLAFEIITTAMLPAIFEELVDRGLLLSILDDGKINDGGKVVVVAVFFGLLHQNIAQLGPTAFGGAVIAFLTIKSGNLYSGIIVHFINNLAVTLLDYSSQKNGILNYIYERIYSFSANFSLIYTLIMVIILILFVFLLMAFSKINKKYRAESENLKGNDITPLESQTESVVIDHYNYRREEFYRIYVEPYLGNKKNTSNTASTKVPPYPKKAKAKWWEFGLLVPAGVLAILGTVFTLIWGLMR